MKPAPRTDALMRRLKRFLASERGRQTALARFLNPAQPQDALTRISEWIHRRKNPNGETTLAILEWLRGRE